MVYPHHKISLNLRRTRNYTYLPSPHVGLSGATENVVDLVVDDVTVGVVVVVSTLSHCHSLLRGHKAGPNYSGAGHHLRKKNTETMYITTSCRRVCAFVAVPYEQQLSATALSTQSVVANTYTHAKAHAATYLPNPLS